MAACGVMSHLSVGGHVGGDCPQVELVTVDRPGLVIHRLGGVPRPGLTHTLQRTQHSATYRTHTHTHTHTHIQLLKLHRYLHVSAIY